MLWIKRNLFLAIGGLVALVLLAFGVWFLLGAIQKNNELETKVEETKSRLNNLYNSPDPFPSANNIDIAKRETEKLRESAGRAHKYFVPVPFERVTGLAFRTFRDNTIDELRRMALAAQTELPARTYAFSFTVQKDQTTFSPSTFPLIPQQMAEVKAICSILFEARIARLGNLRRAKVSDEDFRSSGSDYNNLYIETNMAAQVITAPYEVTFHCYSSELAQVMTAFNKSPHGLVLKALQVEPEEGVKIAEAGGPEQPPVVAAPARPQFPSRPRGGPGSPTGSVVLPRQGAAVAPPAARRPAPDRPTILLNEKRFKATALLFVIRPLK